MMVKREEGVSPVIAVILMVAITVVLAAVAWLMVSGMVSKLDVPPAYISLSKENTQSNPSERIIHVAGVDRSYNLLNFEAVLIINISADENSRMDPLVDGTTGNLTFKDTNGDGKLNVGDDFIVSIVPGRSYEIKVFWKKTGNQLASSDTWTE